MVSGPSLEAEELDLLSTHILLRDLLTQKCAQKILVTDFGYPRAFRKKIGPRTFLY
jgi:hypothetical protein